MKKKASKVLDEKIEKLTIELDRTRAKARRARILEELDECLSLREKRQKSKLRINITPEFIISSLIAVVTLAAWYDINKDGIIRAQLPKTKF